MHLKPDLSQDDAPKQKNGCASQVIVIITGSNYLTLEVPEERGSQCFRNQFPTNYTTMFTFMCTLHVTTNIGHLADLLPINIQPIIKIISRLLELHCSQLAWSLSILLANPQISGIISSKLVQQILTSELSTVPNLQVCVAFRYQVSQPIVRLAGARS